MNKIQMIFSILCVILLIIYLTFIILINVPNMITDYKESKAVERELKQINLYWDNEFDKYSYMNITDREKIDLQQYIFLYEVYGNLTTKDKLNIMRGNFVIK